MLMCTMPLAKILVRDIDGIQARLFLVGPYTTNHNQLLLPEINQQEILLVPGIR